MKKLIYFLLLIPFLFLSCSKDSSSSANYSIEGMWETRSSVLNGVELHGGTNTIKSEHWYFYNDGSFESESYTDSNFGNVYIYSLGTYTPPSNSTLNLTAEEYTASGVLVNSFNKSIQVVKLNASQLELKILNYPNQNDVYVKKFIK
jgi:hypothetical protein